jgi:catechol 2,3-dioxygenase-like lactoylglutathione lyase family enzyme
MSPFSRITPGENLRVFDHVTIRVRDREASRAFYTAALGEPTHDGEYTEWGAFGITTGGEVSANLHAAFGVEDRAAVDAWWQRLTAAGYASDGEPGPRPVYGSTYYGAFVLDPDGNSVEAVHHETSRSGELDHLWLRTADVAAVRQFYCAVAGPVGIRLRSDAPQRVQFSDGEGSFSFVAGSRPTRNVHLAFGVPGAGAVEAFHAAALAAGYADNGAPGERPQYHPGYFGAFVLDPDGNNVEAVFHDRG